MDEPPTATVETRANFARGHIHEWCHAESDRGDADSIDRSDPGMRGQGRFSRLALYPPRDHLFQLRLHHGGGAGRRPPHRQASREFPLHVDLHHRRRPGRDERRELHRRTDGGSMESATVSRLALPGGLLLLCPLPRPQQRRWRDPARLESSLPAPGRLLDPLHFPAPRVCAGNNLAGHGEDG
jgi:hypothetical protein